MEKKEKRKKKKKKKKCDTPYSSSVPIQAERFMLAVPLVLGAAECAAQLDAMLFATKARRPSSPRPQCRPRVCTPPLRVPVSVSVSVRLRWVLLRASPCPVVCLSCQR